MLPNLLSYNANVGHLDPLGALRAAQTRTGAVRSESSGLGVVSHGAGQGQRQGPWDACGTPSQVQERGRAGAMVASGRWVTFVCCGVGRMLS
jgi:hypothetical protein